MRKITLQRIYNMGRAAGHKLLLIATLALGLGGLTACIEDGVSTSPSDQPTFSTDTLRMGELLTATPSPTSRFVVYNRHDKVMNISDIAFRDNDGGQFRINVDGISGSTFQNVEVRPNDSIFVFVEATLRERNDFRPFDVVAHIDFRVNGVTTTMPVKATGQDVVRMWGENRITADRILPAGKPIHVKDSIVVEEGVTLTIDQNARLLMHDGARIVVHGTLVMDGKPDNEVQITGDRLGFVAAQIPYEVMSGQWEGILFTPTSKNNRITNASIRNSSWGLLLDHCGGTLEAPALTIVNSQVRNTKAYVLEAQHSSVRAAGCEFSEAAYGIVRLDGGEHRFSHCSIGNFYLFAAVGGPAIQMTHLDPSDREFNDTYDRPEDATLPWMKADFDNTIIHAYGGELSHSDLAGTQVRLRNCLLRSPGHDDDNFIRCLWDSDPLWHIDREAYIFDYRLDPASVAIPWGDPTLTDPLTATDRFGTPRHADASLPPALGAYQAPR